MTSLITPQNITYRRIEMSDPLYQGEREVRNRVLLRPIGVPDFGWEMLDKDSAHFVAVKDSEVIGCALLYLKEAPGISRLMQMAVDETLQGLGIGKRLVEALLGYAREENFSEVTCHARDNVIRFYEKLGFHIYGKPFEEVGLGHHHMKIAL